MPVITALDIPYERQSDTTSNRTCGAAALSMVYRSFGRPVAHTEVVARLARPGAPANTAARTYLLAQDALARGLGAIVLRARDPLRMLRDCHTRRLRVILNHRSRPESANGHFTVLVDYVGQLVVVHDPLLGPNTRIFEDDLLKLWQPLGGSSEITGNVLIALTMERHAVEPCPGCGVTPPDTITCPACGRPIPLQPMGVLGCVGATCPQRAWEILFCPVCDFALTGESGKDFRRTQPSRDFGAADSGRGPDSRRRDGPGPEQLDEDPRKLKSLSQEIDRFVAILLSVNNGRPVPGVEPYFARIRDIQSQLLELQKTEAAELRAKAMQQHAEKLTPDRPPVVTPVPTAAAAPPPPRPPVDWNELGRKLIEEIGRRPA